MPLSGGLRFTCGYTVRSYLFVSVKTNFRFLFIFQMTRAVLGDAIALVRGMEWMVKVSEQ